MAHYTITDRKSLKTNLEGRYLAKQPAGGAVIPANAPPKTGLQGRYLAKQKAGGAFDAYRWSTFNTMLDAGNGSIQSILLTINPGIQPVGPYPNKPKENFNGKALNYIDDHGFNNKKYTDVLRR